MSLTPPLDQSFGPFPLLKRSVTNALLAMIDLLAVQLSTRTRIHNAPLFIDTPTMLGPRMFIRKMGRHA